MIYTIAAFGCIPHTVKVKVAYHVICLQREKIYQCLWLGCISLVLPHAAKGGVLKLLQDAGVKEFTYQKPYLRHENAHFAATFVK